MAPETIPLPTDYCRPIAALASRKASPFGVADDHLMELQGPKGALFVLVGGHPITPNPVGQFDIATLGHPNGMTNAPRGIRVSDSTFANVREALSGNATGSEPNYRPAMIMWDEVNGVDAVTMRIEANTAMGTPPKERRMFVGTRSVVDVLMSLIYSELAAAASAAVEVTKRALPSHSVSVKRVRDLGGLTASEIAEVFGVRRETVQRWIAAGPINRHHATALNFVEVLFGEVVRRVGANELRTWLRTPSMLVVEDGPRTPLDLLRTGRFDEVHRLVVALPDSNPVHGATELALHRPEYRDDE